MQQTAGCAFTALSCCFDLRRRQRCCMLDRDKRGAHTRVCQQSGVACVVACSPICGFATRVCGQVTQMPWEGLLAGGALWYEQVFLGGAPRLAAPPQLGVCWEVRVPAHLAVIQCRCRLRWSPVWMRGSVWLFQVCARKSSAPLLTCTVFLRQSQEGRRCCTTAEVVT